MMHPKRIDEHRWEVFVDPEWPGFAGHFPDDPLLPGAALIQQALACTDELGHPQPAIRKARFRAPVRPGMTIEWTADPSGLRLSATVEQVQVCEVKFSPSAIQ